MPGTTGTDDEGTDHPGPGATPSKPGGSLGVTAMPITADPDSRLAHRGRMATEPLSMLVAVARHASPTEQKHNVVCAGSLADEWGTRKGSMTSYESSVCEFSAAKHRVLDEGRPAHDGRLFGLCVGKHSELPPDRRAYRGRAVFSESSQMMLKGCRL